MFMRSRGNDCASLFKVRLYRENYIKLVVNFIIFFKIDNLEYRCYDSKIRQSFRSRCSNNIDRFRAYTIE